MVSKKVGQLMSAYEIISKQKTMPVINGWVGYGLDSKGNVMAGMNQKGLDFVGTFPPTGEWKETAEILQAQLDFRRLLLGLNDKEINEFRTLRGYPTMEEEARGVPIVKKKEFNPNHDPDNGQFTSGDGGGDSGNDSANAPSDTGAGRRPSSGSSGSAPKKEPVEYNKAASLQRKFAETTKMTAYSFDPQANRGYDLTNEQDIKDFHAAHSDGSSPVYVIAVTNHLGDQDRENESAYNQIANDGKSPLMGFWKSPNTGFEYNDSSFPIDHGISDNEVRALLKHYAQESAIVSSKDGTWRFVNAYP